MNNSNQPQPIRSPADLQGLERTRIINRFDIPERITKLCGIKTIGLVELTAAEELMAGARAGTSASKLMHELVKESIREIDSARVSTADGTADKAWDTMPKPLRDLCVAAYQLFSAQNDEVDAFLKSRKVQVG